MSRLTLTLRTPAQIGHQPRAEFVLGTQTHLPGAVVRGAFAARWLTRNGGSVPASGPARDEFLRLFEGGVRFGPLFDGPSPTPLSVLGHKYPPRDTCADVDIDLATGDWAGGLCPDCGSPMESRTAPADTVAGKVRRRTHVAIDSAGVAAPGQLVTREVLPAGLAFSGALVGDADALEALAGLGPTVRVGGRRTTHGLAEVAVDPRGALPLPELRPDGAVVLRLRSPGVFVDDLGRPSRDPNPAELAEVLGCPATVERRWTRWVTVTGWHAASGLPKPTELAVAAGSTYLVKPSGAVTDEQLGALVRRGLGLRRHEGFGDLAGRPELRRGRRFRDQLSKDVAPLVGMSVHPDRWRLLLRVIEQLTTDRTGAQAILAKWARPQPEPVRVALRHLLDLDPADVRWVVEEWKKL